MCACVRARGCVCVCFELNFTNSILDPSISHLRNMRIYFMEKALLLQTFFVPKSIILESPS